MADIPYNPLNKRCLAVDACPTAVCNCKSNESCEIKYRTCDQCDVVTCIPNSQPQSGSISGGAVAGAVVGCVIVSALLAGLIWFLRRRRAARKAQVMAAKRPTPYTVESSVGTPAGEKPPTLPPSSPRTPNANGTSHTLHYTESVINLDPFADTHSVHSATSSHVIPIAYVPPNSASMSLADGHSRPGHLSITSLPPSRPHRSPDLNLKLEPPKSAASRLSTGQELHPPRFSSPYAASQRSGMSRASTISSVGSFVYGDTPVVVSQAQGGVRQVLGVARPEVVQVPAAGLASGPPTPGSGTGADLVRSFSQRSKKNAGTMPPIPDFAPQQLERSPFSPESELGADPFADKENETASYSVRSVNTFGQPGVPGRDIRSSKSPPHTSSTFLAEPLGYDSRPSSIGTVIEGSAQRVVLGTAASASTEDLAALPPVPARRTSGASVADSILAGFPFVPPSPVGQGSDHRPGSLAMSVSESFSDPNPPPVPPLPTLSELARQEEQALEQGQVARLPPSRHTLGMSTFSSASGISSSGLEAFPFQFGPAGGAPRDSLDTNPDVDLPSKHVVRASLDTLALSRDVEAFPLPESSSFPKRP
ncbi:unnamed protein product [Rhizoctonia solani]|uniref:Membrane anchor Opy2 N-terminal domain-containing protein n=1 Tax=Rhizoctonia solani TaxID=456999 RepID=A0A8H2XIS8_9AGAM|nr:unnamed protein product [Rhizoctonia solani]